MKLKTLIRAARVPFLALTPVCLLLAYALARLQNRDISVTDSWLVFIGALAAHLAVNLLNEYQDFHSGLDLITQKTDFSGGSGALPDDPDGANGVFWACCLCLFVVCMVGSYFLVQGWFSSQSKLLLLVIGLSGLMLIVTYTRWLNRLPLVCLLAPGFGFGILMILGSVLLLAHHINTLAVIVSLVPFFHINSLLLLNQYPDIEADQSIGRNHFLIAFGVLSANKVYGSFMLLPFLLISGLIVKQSLPWLSVIALLPLLLGACVFAAASRLGAEIAKSPKYLAMNVAVTLATTFLLALSLLVS